MIARPRAPRPRAILFDWDGTLLDSAETTFRCYRTLFAPYGIDFDRELFTRTYAPDWYRTYEDIGLAPELWKEADSRWLQIYRAEPCELVAGARESLARIASTDVRAALVTSGSRSRIEADLDRLGLHEIFAAVVCGDDAARKKPHPEALQAALARLEVAASEAAYVGDSPEDVAMARAADVFAVGVEGAFPNVEALRKSGPDLLARDLAQAVEELLGKT